MIFLYSFNTDSLKMSSVMLRLYNNNFERASNEVDRNHNNTRNTAKADKASRASRLTRKANEYVSL